MSGYVLEYIEIDVTHTALIGAAQADRDHKTRRVCEYVVSQEVGMARWPIEDPPQTTTT